MPRSDIIMDDASEEEEVMGGACSARLLSRRELGIGSTTRTTTRSRVCWCPAVGAGFVTILLIATVLMVLDGALRPRELERPIRFLWRTPAFLRFPAGACDDGWLPILSKSDCEAAARDLVLSVGEAVRTQFENRPSGCYLVRSAKAKKDSLWLNEAPPGSSTRKNQTHFGKIDGWLPEPLCKRKTSLFQPKPLPVPVPAPKPTPAPLVTSAQRGSSSNRSSSGGSSSSRTDRLTFVEEASSATPPVVCRYVKGEEGKTECPQGTGLNESECWALPYYTGGGVVHYPLTENNPRDPVGCFMYRSKYYFNRHSPGGNAQDRRLYCKSCNKPDQLGDWAEWGSESYQTLVASAKANARFRKLSVGKCSDIGWYSIAGRAACAEAGKYLALSDVEVKESTYQERPEGCYFYRNYQDWSETLWVNMNPLSDGNGAETSDLLHGGLRQPICSSRLLPHGKDTKAKEDMSFSLQFRKIPKGRCMDIGWQPILDPETCKEASLNLGLADDSPTTMNIPNNPEGCYYFFNSEDLTATLWFNVSPLSRGNGAQEAEHRPHGIRQPLCSNPNVASDELASLSLGGELSAV
mmetsp:Transcript_97929/g.189074  ORF Transcript_97929/g.189074 Transcript_97929/m.189074 type:complete len:580 (-) Transcript_97929:61-1800(-)